MTRIQQTTREPVRAIKLPVATPARTPVAPTAATLAANPLAVTAHRATATAPAQNQVLAQDQTLARTNSHTIGQTIGQTNSQTNNQTQGPRPAAGQAQAQHQTPTSLLLPDKLRAAPSPAATARQTALPHQAGGTPRAPSTTLPPARSAVGPAVTRQAALLPLPSAFTQASKPAAASLPQAAPGTAPNATQTGSPLPPGPPETAGVQRTQVSAGTNPHSQATGNANDTLKPASPPTLTATKPLVAASRDGYAPAARGQAQALPSQRLLDSLGQLTRASSTSRGSLESGASRLLTSVNTPEQMVRPEGLKKAVLNSGLFLEARLAGKSAEPTLDLGRDFKAALLRLRSELRVQLPASNDGKLTDVASQVERTLARLDLSQLATVAAEREHRPAWALEIPVRTPEGDVEVARLNIQREGDEADGSEEEQRGYSAVLKLEPAGLGAVTARINVVGEHVSVGFQVTDPKVQQSFQERLEALRTNLGRRGLQATRLSAEKAAPASAEDAHTPFMDTKA